jgi:ABC-2 type transport system permease protein
MAASSPGITAAPPVPHRQAGRVYGLGSVFGKTLRDSTRGMVAISGVLVFILVAGAISMGSAYGTPATRVELKMLTQTLPDILVGVYGNPVNVDTLGGFLSWHYGAYFAMLTGLWSILVLSGTLAGEARRGSLDLAAATGQSRRSIALQKVAGHVAALAVAMTLLAVAAWAASNLFAKLPGDAVPPASAVAFAVGIGLRALIPGAIAFALAPLLGRGAAAGLAGALMVGGYVVYSYRTVVPAFDAVAGVTWWSWAAGHIPLAGVVDLPAIALLVIVSAGLIAVGVEAFARRDIGVTAAIPTPSLPAVILGTGGPLRRSFGDFLPIALAWGVALGLYGIVMAVSSRALTETLAGMPGIAEMARRLIPGMDITTSAGWLQFTFAEMGFVLVGVAAATLVAGRSSDETAGRLELQLTTPLTRVRWVVASTIALWLAIVVITALLGSAIAVGVLAIGQDPVGPALGTVVISLYAIALAGIGVGVAGLWQPASAGMLVLVIALGTFLVDLFAPLLQLPDWVGELALTAHLGEPMVGDWDVAGIAACIAIALGGLALGALGMHRRDIGR